MRSSIYYKFFDCVWISFLLDFVCFFIVIEVGKLFGGKESKFFGILLVLVCVVGFVVVVGMIVLLVIVFCGLSFVI